jgi:hypothetical protein
MLISAAIAKQGSFIDSPLKITEGPKHVRPHKCVISIKRVYTGWFVFPKSGKVSLSKKLERTLIAYFPSIRRGSHRKRSVQQFFYCVCIRCRWNVYISEPLPANDRGKYTCRQQDDLISLLLFICSKSQKWVIKRA